MEILLSIIVPIYNVSLYLDDCIKSILNKTEDNIEILLIDDGSTDTSGKIADGYANKYDYISVFHKKNGGLSDARNYGLMRAKGKYVFFIDSDDFMVPYAIDNCCAIIRNRTIDALLWDADIYDENGNLSNQDSSYYHHLGLGEKKLYSGREIIEKQLDHHNDYVTTVWLGLYNREFLVNNNFWFEKGLLHEDEMWTQKVLIDCNYVLYINKPLYCYRKRKNSIMNQEVKDYSRNIASLIYIHSSLPIYYDWKLEDKDFICKLKGNTSKRYLHMIGKYNVSKYPDLAKRINRIQIFFNSTTRKDKIRALLLCISIKLYCTMMSFLKDN